MSDDGQRKRARTRRGILADRDIEGILEVLGYVWFSPEWKDVFVGVGLSIESFDSVGLARESSDRDVWRTCQREQLVLFRGNRIEIERYRGTGRLYVP